jgi:hypothetical protein
MNKKLINLLLITTIAISCCKKEPKPKEERRYGPTYYGKYADYLMFKPGSIWIYENNKTGELDSCELWAIERDTPTYFYEGRQYKVWYTKERINYDIKSTGRRGIIPYRTSTPCLDCGVIDTTLKFNLKRSSSDFVLYDPYNYVPNQNAYYPTYKIVNEVFNDVYRYDVYNGSSLPYWDHNLCNLTPPYTGSYYWAKDVGLISIKVIGGNEITQNLDSMFWNLKTYNIQKF